MKRIFLALLGMCSFWATRAQNPDFYNSTASASVNNYPLSSTIYNKAQWLFAPGEFGSGGTGVGTAAYAGSITKIFLRLGNTVNPAATYTNFSISLSQNIGTSTGFGSTAGNSYNFTTGMVQVFSSSSFTMTGATANSWYGITLSTPFTYDPALSLVMEVKVSGGTGNQIRLLSGANPQRIYGGYSATTGTSAAGNMSVGVNMVHLPLPVSLSLFNGKQQGGSDHLFWTSQSESNLASYQLMHGTDAEHFSLLQSIPSKAPQGNSSTPLSYETINTQPVSGHNYYRLDMMDINGQASGKSQVIDLYRSSNATVLVYPNPSHDVLHVQVNTPNTEGLFLQLNNLQGQKIITLHMNDDHAQLDLSSLSPGSYFLQIRKGEQVLYADRRRDDRCYEQSVEIRY